MPRAVRPASLSRFLLVSSLALVLAGPVFASGGYGGPGRDHSRGATRSRTDPTYDLGKSIYQGHSKTARGLTICLATAPDSEGKRTAALSSRTLHRFRGRTRTDLGSRLVDCASPASKVEGILAASEFRSLVYYLDKRFKLELKS